MYLCGNGYEAIHSIVTALNSPNRDIQKALLETLLEVFETQMARDNGQAEEKSISVFTHFSSQVRVYRPSFSDRCDLIERHMAALLVIFVECGLLNVLFEADCRRWSQLLK